MSERPFNFFYDAGSCSLAVRIVLEETGARYVGHRISARTTNDAASQPAWLARNPKGRVPALSPVPGQAAGEALLLTEVPAIMTYLARLRPDLDLMPIDPSREARTIEWTNWLSGWLHAVAFAGLWRPGRFSNDESAHAGIAARGRATVLDAFATIERTLGDERGWAVPESFTVADAFLLVFYRWGTLIDADMAPYHSWTELTRRSMARPAVATAFRKDGLDPVPLPKVVTSSGI